MVRGTAGGLCLAFGVESLMVTAIVNPTLILNIILGNPVPQKMALFTTVNRAFYHNKD